jgi:hypothetical protein
MWHVVATAALICCLVPVRSDACTVRILTHQIDPAEQGVDTRAPDRVVAEVGRIVRGRAGYVAACDHLGTIEVELVHFQDDRTPVEKLGYRVTLLDGTPPERFQVPPYEGFFQAPEEVRLPVIWPAGARPRFLLHWVDGAQDEQEPFDFRFVVTAVDLAGNESEPSAPIRATHPGTPSAALD